LYSPQNVQVFQAAYQGFFDGLVSPSLGTGLASTSLDAYSDSALAAFAYAQEMDTQWQTNPTFVELQGIQFCTQTVMTGRIQPATAVPKDYSPVVSAVIAAVTQASQTLADNGVIVSGPTLPIEQNASPSNQGLDAFHRQRVSNPQTLLSSKLLYDAQPLVWDDAVISGAGTSSNYAANQAMLQLGVTGNVAGHRARQTFQCPIYQPDKGQHVSLTGTMLGDGGPDNGAWYVVTRTFTSGAPVDTAVAQANWNIDTLDGTNTAKNPSGIKLQASDSQLFVIDYQWLSVGIVRYGFDINGAIHYCHYNYVANASVLPSTSNPNVPVRFEIASDGAGGITRSLGQYNANNGYFFRYVNTVSGATVAKLNQICCSVISEGGQEDIGDSCAVDMGGSIVATANDAKVYGLIFLRLAAGKVASIIPTLVSFNNVSFGGFNAQLWQAPVIAGPALTWVNVPGSNLQVAIGDAGGANTLTGGKKIYSNLIYGNYNLGSPPLINNAPFGFAIDGTSVIVALAVQQSGVNGAGASSYTATFAYREQT
jgi:hypothetical protein